jgi:polysaccharide pyruvyl transferase WcaK-like protein
MKILLAGGYDTQNLGDHGSLAVFKRDLKKLDPSSEVVLLSRHPDKRFDDTYNVHSINNLDHTSKLESIGKLFKGLNPGDDTNHLKKIMGELSTSDLLVIGNGRLLIDVSLDFMRGPLPYYAMLVTLAKFLGVPVMIFSMTIVPVKSEIGRTLLKYIVSNADIITVREESSMKELLKLGISCNKINVIPDAAFGLDYIDREERGKQILAQERIKVSNDKIIGMNLRYTHLEISIDKNYYSTLARLCDDLYQSLGTDILLIPQMTYGIDNSLDDDREVYKLVYENCVNKEHIHIITERYNVFDTLAIYQMCKMVYSMRRHGIIFAATQQVPVFALSGEKNTSYIMKELNMSEYEIDISNINNKNNLKHTVDAYKHREEIADKLSQSIPILKKKTIKYAETALNYSN